MDEVIRTRFRSMYRIKDETRVSLLLTLDARDVTRSKDNEKLSQVTRILKRRTWVKCLLCPKIIFARPTLKFIQIASTPLSPLNGFSIVIHPRQRPSSKSFLGLSFRFEPRTHSTIRTFTMHLLFSQLVQKLSSLTGFLLTLSDYYSFVHKKHAWFSTICYQKFVYLDKVTRTYS